ncbi:MAG: hypothetical protein HY424_03420 [Candidatus Levybacteria bacterium]|nr:hypothetical protein [Candidatus Levybacteria bacterium]
MFEVIPGILEKEWSEIERKIELVKPFAKVIHVDIIDGKFAPNTTFLDPKPFQKFTPELFFELHMMVENPIEYLKPFADAGFKRFLGHIEKMEDQEEFVAQGQLLGEVGLAIDGPTNIDSVKVPFEDLDCLLLMTIKAGQSGQTFVPEYLKKTETLRQTQGHLPTLEIDGGINSETIIQAKNAGATRFVATNYIFKGHDPKAQFDFLQRLNKEC